MFQDKLRENGIFDVRTMNIGGGGGLNAHSDIKDFLNMPVHLLEYGNQVVTDYIWEVFEKQHLTNTII